MLFLRWVELNWYNVLSSLLAAGSLIISVGALYMAFNADRRARSLEDAAPYLQTTPVNFDFLDSFGRIHIEITNLGPLPAYDVSVDIRYHEYDWISEWLTAKDGRQRKLDQLPAGKAVFWWFQGELPFPVSDICEKRKDLPILMRTRWRNERGGRFDLTRAYALHCTTVNDRRTVTFIPREE
ncbi:MAG: hypothetical protein HY713_06470 [candidate division NC10 bacterium]|nr:hypothetical protein [candidate division NC10 bacterium]